MKADVKPNNKAKPILTIHSLNQVFHWEVAVVLNTMNMTIS